VSGKAKKIKTTRKRMLDDDMAAKGYVSTTIAAELLRMDASNVYRLCEDGKLDHVRLGGEKPYSRTYVKKDSLRKFLGPEMSKMLGV
jgi:hypothetical protein